MHVSAILADKGNAVFSVGPKDDVAKAVDLLTEKRIGAIPIVEDGIVRGMFSERDLVRTLSHAGSAILTREVSEFMTSDVFTCGLEDTVDYLMGVMTERRIRHLPVLDDGKIVGMITIGDVVKFRIAEAEAETDALKSYIASG